GHGQDPGGRKQRRFCGARLPGEHPALWGLQAPAESARNAADCAPDAMFFVVVSCVLRGLIRTL
ncbi:hypothetical protein, partial [Escherichia coli]|uniref:hypothetical protein n=1 Tax=Escherichia coli TaxID=562 RepID=UPI001A8D499B